MGDWGALGVVLAEKGSEVDQANVHQLVKRAEDLLKMVQQTFPTYTLHDQRHAENVIRLIGKLAAPRIDEMEGLEAALLILAAYFHDAGMAYQRSELAGLTEDDDFAAFLNRHDRHQLAVNRNGGVVPDDVVQQYCRDRHAERVRWHLSRCESLLVWQSIPILEPLVTVCRSHNEDAADLHDPRFDTDFLYRADLRFCAVLLRLADILDLDDTRAPKVIYDHLELGRRDTPAIAVSDAEWSKHLAARGFHFPRDYEPNYKIKFAAAPDDPRVERDLRTFLAVIKDELTACRSLAEKFDRRWQGIPLPAEIDTSAVTSRGYLYGDFRFELDRGSVLELFTGANLYDDPYAFVRELLQNALDAIRARQLVQAYESAGIQVHCREESDGYLWVRVDDDGIGMDRDRLENYFLRIGKSYYGSEEFAFEQLRSNRLVQPANVIGQFGIGVLACFLAGDQVEVTSRRFVAPGQTVKGVRLSISDRDDYFVLQESDRPGKPMPGPPGQDAAFLREPGSRIAVRIDPNKTDIDAAELERRIKEYVFAPPVPVFVNGQPVAQETRRLIDEPLLAAPEIVELDTDGLQWEQQPTLPWLSKVRIIAVPLDLGTAGISPDVTGQVLAYFALPPDDAPSDPLPGLAATDQELYAALRDAHLSTWLSLGITNYADEREPRVNVIVNRRFRAEAIEAAHRILSDRQLPGPSAAALNDVNSTVHLEHLGKTPQDLRQVIDNMLSNRQIDEADSSTITADSLVTEIGSLPAPDVARRIYSKKPLRSYNGIRLPTKYTYTFTDTLTTSSCITLGAVALSGDMRPELSVSRSEVRSLSFAAHSVLSLTVRKTLRSALTDTDRLPAAMEAIGTNQSIEYPLESPCNATTVAAEIALRGHLWRAEKVIDTSHGWMSIDEIIEGGTGPGAPRIKAMHHRYFDFQSHLIRGLLEYFTSLRFVPDPNGDDGELCLVSCETPERPPAASFFKPLLAVPYDGDESLARAGILLNQRHAFTRWLTEHAAVLAHDFPAPFQKMVRQIEGIYAVDIEAINASMRRIAHARPAIAPPGNAYLRIDEMGQWWSR